MYHNKQIPISEDCTYNDIYTLSDSMILECAQAKVSGIMKWRFVPRSHLYINDKEAKSYVGEVYYNNPLYEIGEAVKIEDWVFCVERMTNSARKRLDPFGDPDQWSITAFHDNIHCSFIDFIHKQHDTTKRIDILLKYILIKFWPIFHSEIFANVNVDTNITITWITIQFKDNDKNKGYQEGGVLDICD